MREVATSLAGGNIMLRSNCFKHQVIRIDVDDSGGGEIRRDRSEA
jgi:hypothetical protein